MQLLISLVSRHVLSVLYLVVMLMGGTPARSQMLPLGGPARGVRITDDGATATVTMEDPSGSGVSLAELALAADGRSAAVRLPSANRPSRLAGGQVVSAVSRYGRFALASDGQRYYRADLRGDAPELTAIGKQCPDAVAPGLQAAMSADGSKVVYSSRCADADAGLYLWDANGEPRLRRLVAGNAASFSPGLTPDAQFVVFTSRATDLTGDNLTAGVAQLYLYELATGKTTLLSRDAAGNGGGNADSYLVLSGDDRWVSADSRYFAYLSKASNLDSFGRTDSNGRTDAYLYDRLTGKTALLSVNASGLSASGDGEVFGQPQLSADGRYVALLQSGRDFGFLNSANRVQAYLLEIEASRYTLLSLTEGSPVLAGEGDASELRISSDASRAVFVLNGMAYAVGNVMRMLTETGVSTAAGATAKGSNGRNTCSSPVSVTSNADTGAGTLRDALANVCAGGTIDLTPIAGQTISLSSRLFIGIIVNILGPANNPVIIDGGNATRLFFIQSGTTVAMSNLTLRNGLGKGGDSQAGGAGAGMGGAIFQNGGTLTLTNVTLSGNRAQGGGLGGNGNGGGGFGGDSGGSNGANSGADGGDLGGIGGAGGVGGGNGGNGGEGAGGGASVTGIGNGGNGGFGAGGGGALGNLAGTGGFGAGGSAGLANGTQGWSGGSPGAGYGGGGGGFGGAIFIRTGTLNLNNVAFQNNVARGGTNRGTGLGKGGGLFAYIGTTVNMAGVTFSGNTAAHAGFNGFGDTPPYTTGQPCPGRDTVDICGTVSGNRLDVTVSGSGTVSDGAGFSCSSGTCSLYGNGSVTLTATPSGGSVFNGYSGGGCSTSPCTLNLASGNIAVTATFAAQTATATTVSSSVNPSTDGQSVAFTATVTPSNATGSVQFTIDGSPAGAPVTVEGGVATFSTSSLTAGNHTVSAAFTGTGVFANSSGSLNGGQNVLTPTSLSVSSSANPLAVGNPVTFTATVSPSNATGSVQFSIDGSPAGSPVTVVGGVATFATSSLSVGNHTVSASFTGTGVFANSTGSLNGGQSIVTATAVTVSSSVNPSTVGQSVTFTATVIPSNATGSVQFTIDGSPAGAPVTVSGGVATFATSSLAAGNHTVSATLTGTGDFGGAIGSLNGGQNVFIAADLTVASSVNPSTVGQSVTFTATVSPSNAAGAVQFSIDGNPAGAPVTVSNGVATFATSSLTGGNHTVSAAFTATGNFTNATGSLNGGQNVNSSTSVSVASSVNPSTVGQSVTFTATVSPSNATGSVEFTIDGNPAGAPVSVSNGVATFATSSLTAGNHTVSAAFTATGNFTNATGSLNGGQNVNISTSLSVASSVNPSAAGQLVTFTATVTPSNATGSVQFSIDGNPAGSPVTVAGGLATFATSSLASGNHTVAAAFTATGSFANSSGSLTGGQNVNLPASKLAIVSGPQAIALVGAPFGLTVQVQDSTGVLVPGSTAAITITSTAPGVAGTTTVNAAGGIATFSNLVFNTPGTYTLTASSPNLASAGSTSITIEPLPAVVSYRVLFGTQSYNLTGSSRVRLPWQITGVQVVFNKPITSGNAQSLSGLTATGFSGLGTNTLTWTIAPLAQGVVASSLASAGANALKDSFGNPIGAFGQAFKVLWADANDDGVVNSADLVLVNNGRTAAYNPLLDVDGSGVVDLTDVNLARGRVGTSQP